jgi:hypothetical protein
MNEGDVIAQIGQLGKYLILITPFQGRANYCLVSIDGENKGDYKVYSKNFVEAEFIVVERHGEMLSEE